MTTFLALTDAAGNAPLLVNAAQITSIYPTADRKYLIVSTTGVLTNDDGNTEAEFFMVTESLEQIAAMLIVTRAQPLCVHCQAAPQTCFRTTPNRQVMGLCDACTDAHDATVPKACAAHPQLRSLPDEPCIGCLQDLAARIEART